MSKNHIISYNLVLLGIIYLVVLSSLDINPKLQIGLTYLIMPLGMIAGMVWHGRSS